jgi:hypothetical protein
VAFSLIRHDCCHLLTSSWYTWQTMWGPKCTYQCRSFINISNPFIAPLKLDQRVLSKDGLVWLAPLPLMHIDRVTFRVKQILCIHRRCTILVGLARGEHAMGQAVQLEYLPSAQLFVLSAQNNCRGLGDNDLDSRNLISTGT